MCNNVTIEGFTICYTCGLYAINVKYHILSLTQLTSHVNQQPRGEPPLQILETRAPARPRMVLRNTLDSEIDLTGERGTRRSRTPSPHFHLSYADMVRGNSDFDLLSTKPPTPK